MKRAVLVLLVLCVAAIGAACARAEAVARPNVQSRAHLTQFWPEATSAVVSIHRDEVPGFQRVVISRKLSDDPPDGRYFNAWAPLSEDFSPGQEVDVSLVNYKWSEGG